MRVGELTRIAWPLTGSVCSFIVRSIPEGLMFREFSSIWEIQAHIDGYQAAQAAAPANEECSIEHGHGGVGFASTKSGGYSAPPQPTPRSSGLPLCRGGSNLQPTTPIMVCARARADTIYDYRGLRPVRSGPGQ